MDKWFNLSKATSLTHSTNFPRFFFIYKIIENKKRIHSQFVKSRAGTYKSKWKQSGILVANTKKVERI